MVEQVHYLNTIPKTLRRMRQMEEINKIEQRKLHKLSDFFLDLDKSQIDSMTANNNLSFEEWLPLVRKLEHFNERIRKLNTLIIKEFKRLFYEGASRVNDLEDWVKDFDIELEVKFFISEDDPSFDIDGENYIAIHRKSIPYKSGEIYIDYLETIGYNNQHNHDSTWHFDGLPNILRRFKHTEILQELYLIQDLSFLEISRIKDIKFEFKMIYKNS